MEGAMNRRMVDPPKTKIICTIGPASEDERVIRAMIENGMNVARLNFSHGSMEDHYAKIKLIREISREMDRPVAILQDLRGPKIRVGEAPENGIELRPGQTFILSGDPVRATQEMISVSYKKLPLEVKPQDRILLADGLLELVVDGIEGNRIYCTVITGGLLTSRKGINLPSGSIQASAATEKDLEDLRFGLEQNVDYVALSFVRTAEDIQTIKDIIRREKKDTPVIAKIEKHEALENIDAIMDVSDGIMVARGDLGVEIPLERVPGIQRMLIKKACTKGKPVIIATQMLRSMVDSPRPTRAEATDVANAVFEGADAIMLSEESAMGSYPIEAVQYMRRIAVSAEADFPFDRHLKLLHDPGISESVAFAACVLADHLNAAAIIATTQSGFTAKQISRFRPKANIIAISPSHTSIRRLSLYWGCNALFQTHRGNTDEMSRSVLKMAQESGYVSSGDKVVITAGHPLWESGTTNMIQVKVIP